MPSKRKKADTGIMQADGTSMIDMVFQLIAFFMVLINFTQADQDLRVVLPKSELAKPPDKPVDNIVTVNLGKDGRIYMGGQEFTTESFGAQLKVERENVMRQGGSRAGGSPKDVTVVVRAHRQAKTGDVQRIIERCQSPDIGFEKFTLRAEEMQ